MADLLAPFTGYGDDTNTSIKFEIVMDGGRINDWSGGPRLAQFGIPNGARTVTQYLGRDPWTVTFRLWFERAADLELLDAVQGQVATLRYAATLTKRANGTIETLLGQQYLTLPDTLLLRVEREVYEIDGSCECDATFQRSGDTSAWYGFSTYAEDE